MAAPSYVGYQRRDTSAYPDWGTIGGTISDVFTNEATRRQEEKDKLEKETRESLQTIMDAPTGEFKLGNEFVLGYAGDAQQMLMELNKQLKAGVIKPRDYTILRQNALDNANRMFGIMKGYQEEYANKMDRFQKGESAGREAWEMEQIEGLANLKNTRAYIDPTTFDVSIAKVDDKGNIIKESIVGMKQLENRMKTKYDKYNLGAALDKEKASLGTFVRASKTPGKITTITDIKDNPEWGEYVNGVVEKIKANPFNAESILIDQMGYEYTRDPKEAAANPEMILMEQAPDGTFQAKITPDQEKAIAERIKGDLEIRLEDEVKIQAVTEPRPLQPTSYQIRSSGWDRQAQEVSDILIDLYSGDARTKENAGRELAGYMNANAKKDDKKVKDVVITDDRVVVEYVDGSTDPISFISSEGEGLNVNEFIRNASFITDDDEIRTRISNAERDPNTKFGELGRGQSVISKGFTPEKRSWDKAVVMTGLADEEITLAPQAVNTANTPDKLAGGIANIFSEINGFEGVSVVEIKEVDSGSLFTPNYKDIIIDTPKGQRVIRFSKDSMERQNAVKKLYDELSYEEMPTRRYNETKETSATNKINPEQIDTSQYE